MTDPLTERMKMEGVEARDTTEAEYKQAALRTTGEEAFDALSAAEQDELIGKPAAEKIRAGEATLADFVKRDGDFITQKPVEDV